MAPVRKEKASSIINSMPKPQVEEAGSEYDAAIMKLRTTLKITPKTAKHLCTNIPAITWLRAIDGMGYTSPEKLVSPKITPDLLEAQMQEYLERTKQTFASAPKRSGAMYRVAFRRILWTAGATEEEKTLYPDRMKCNYWSNKAIAAREAKEGDATTPTLRNKRLRREEITK